jgi:hypothetical protein
MGLAAGLAMGVCQTVTGVAQIELSVDSLVFNPTTIYSLSVMEVTVSNALSVDQQVTLTGLSAPFSTLQNPLLVPAEGSTQATVYFNPISVSTFTNEVIATGSAFGADTMVVQGEGTLPGAELLQDTLDFGAVSVNSVATAYVPIVSSGLGSLFISGLTSTSPEIYMDAGVSIPQGDTLLVPIRFFSEFSGVYTIDAVLHTTDPFNPNLDLHCTISAISEVGGEVCGTWSLVNSPYLLIDNIVVPESCTLTIEPGVIVLGDEYDIEVFGGFFADGVEGNEVDITCGELLSHTSADHMVLTHSVVTETNEVEFSDYDYRILRDENPYSFDSLPEWFDYPYFDASDLYPNENTTGHIGRYYEAFDDNSGQGWSRGGSVDSWSDDGQYRVYYAGNSSYTYEHWIYSPTFTFAYGEYPETISFHQWMNWWSDCNDYALTYISVNGGADIEIDYFDCDYQADSTFVFDLSDHVESIESIQSLQVKWKTRFRYYGETKVDSIDLRTNLYPGFDLDYGVFLHDQSNDAYLGNMVHTLSTGGLTLDNTVIYGDFHSVGDSIGVYLLNSTLTGNASRAKSSHGIGLYAYHTELALENSTIANHVLEGIHVRSNSNEASFTNSIIQDNGSNGIEIDGDLNMTSSSLTISGNGSNGIHATAVLTLTADSLFVTGNAGDGIEALGNSSSATMYQVQIADNGGDGIRLSGSNNAMDVDYSFFRDNGGDGMDMGSGSTLEVDNSLIGYNGSNGIRTSGAATINYSDILHNAGTGIYTGDFSTVNNSIVWFNGGVPQMTTNNSYAVSYTNVQGINALLTNYEFAWGDGCIGTDPVLIDDQGHLDPYSPCVDGGMPWEQDAHIPMGLGSSRADMGMYGGPENEFWGGQAPPDGSVVITDVFDIPNDQGGQLGIQFLASPFDFGGLGFNVTYYSIWRDLAVASDTLIDVDEGNWEQIGTVPAQGFNQYGYTAETLVNSYPEDPGCVTNFIVLAHTTDNNIYWVSSVAGACAIDNLAPSDPEINGLILEEGNELAVQISWAAPEESDYAYTEIVSNGGFNAQLNSDTLVVDDTVLAGITYTYTVIHTDINGNVSNPSLVMLTPELGVQTIPLNAGWNLISADRALADADIESIFENLLPGNLDYVTGFNASGVEFYDPNGLSFLNSLGSLSNGYGYWVRVQNEDTLEISGTVLNPDFIPALASGWNLIGYPNLDGASPELFFSDFISEGTLEYVTGYNQGSSFFDPEGLPFLNSLNGLFNGFGYWVKVSEAFDPNGLATDGINEPLAALTGAPAQHANPNFMLVNGTSDLTHAAGTQVQVRRADESVVANLSVLEGGYLMTKALFGDDPATDGIEGLQVGEPLHFEHHGQRADQTMTYSGQMDVKYMNLTFGAAKEMASVFPNPFSETLQVSATLETPGHVFCELTDAMGKVVAQQPMGWQAKGALNGTWDVSGLAPGMYTCKIFKGDEVLLTAPVLKRN